jgi:epoxyqueuosine reductase
MIQDDLKETLKTEAARLGFNIFGVTTPEPPEHYGLFQEWLQNGYHAGLKYLERNDTLQKRANPKLLLSECKSVICLGYPYPLNRSEPDDAFKIASYARLEDYHLLFPRLLAKLQTIIAKASKDTTQSRVFTDSAPILERELASRAGLGWIGKNSCLIHPIAGSVFLLAEIFTSLELCPDEPFNADRCGTCTKCIEACPAKCILPGRVIDAGRCISYLTIENPEKVPGEYRQCIGTRVFGCDICQEVCPWNSRKSNTTFDGNSLSTVIDFQLFIDLLDMDDLTFRRFFEGSTLLRSGRLGLIRNFLIAIGNSANRAFFPLLRERFSSFDNPDFREYAEWALRKTN